MGLKSLGGVLWRIVHSLVLILGIGSHAAIGLMHACLYVLNYCNLASASLPPLAAKDGCERTE
jgi:hypothetical protein